MNKFLENIKNAFSGRSSMIINALDIVLFAFLLYAIFAFLKKNNASRLIKYIALFLILAVVLSSEALGFPIMGKIFGAGIIILLFALALLFPQEIRRGLWKLSSPKEIQETFNTQYDCSDEELKIAIENIVRAALNMAKKDIGALIAIAPEAVPNHILESGTKLDALLSCSLLESIFNTKAPLHDGAVFIRGNRIMAAGCFLPLTQSVSIDKELGTRHRAAIGVTETNNVLTIIVSEETGVISVAYGGEIKRYYDSAMLTDTLEQVYGLKVSGMNSKKKKKKVVKK